MADRLGQTPLAWAVSSGHEEVVRVFLEWNEQLNALLVTSGTLSLQADNSRRDDHGFYTHSPPLKCLTQYQCDPQRNQN